MLLFSESQFCGTQVTFTSFLVFNFSFRKMFLPIGKTISATILAGSHSFRKLFSRTIFLSDFSCGSCSLELFPFRDFSLRNLFYGTPSLSAFFLADIYFPCGNCSNELHPFRDLLLQIFFFTPEIALPGKSKRPCYFDSASGLAFGKTLKSKSW